MTEKYLPLDEGSHFKPVPKEPELSFEIAQTPANWVRNGVILAGILSAAAAVISFKVAEHFREKKISDKTSSNNP